MSMYNNLRKVVTVFRYDEILLRLLYYPPENIKNNIKDPLDKSLEDMLVLDEDWSIRDKRILLVSKSDDLVDDPICRIYLYAGRRTPQNGNFKVANQEIVVDVLCHNNFEKDLRSMRISDRINELLVHERVAGMGKIEYIHGNQISSPVNYIGYRHLYEFAVTKR
ncbi:hypothetical protein [Robertmurraya siralis]|uniref:hypothetical protein n=1 Tax=Robertmurraya siralis TaxID=77777 RepID=UPI001476BFE6|nr:hypothetical protein [Robertmurraya siralis]